MTEAGIRHRLLRTSAVLFACVALSGCAGALLSASGPSIREIRNQAEAPAAGDHSPYALIDLSAETIGPYLRPADAPPALVVGERRMSEPRLAPGDVIRVMLADTVNEAGVFAPLASGGTVFEQLRIGADERVSLPYVGHIRLAGLTLFEAEERIRARLEGIAVEPQVHVTLTSERSATVLVAGAVRKPGRVSTLNGPLTLLDAINEAGGAVPEPYLVRVTVRSGTEAESYNYEDIMQGRNRMLAPGTEVVLDRNRLRFVAMGAVGKPGLHDFPSARPSLLEALGLVGGLRDTASDATGVFIFRLETPASAQGAQSGEPQARVFRLNLADPAAIFLARRFLVHPEDAIYVTNAAVHEWQKIISPIVQVLVLGRTIDSLGN